MANKAEEKRSERIRTLIQDSNKIINDFDQKKVKLEHEVISKLLKDVSNEIDHVKHWIGNMSYL